MENSMELVREGDHLSVMMLDILAHMQFTPYIYTIL